MPVLKAFLGGVLSTAATLLLFWGALGPWFVRVEPADSEAEFPVIPGIPAAPPEPEDPAFAVAPHFAEPPPMPLPLPDPGMAIGPEDEGNDGALAAAVLIDWERRTDEDRNAEATERPFTALATRPGGSCPRCGGALKRVQPGFVDASSPYVWSEWLACPSDGIYWSHRIEYSEKSEFHGPFAAASFREGSAVRALILDERSFQESIRRLLPRVEGDPLSAKRLLDLAWEAPVLARDELAACRARALEAGDDASVATARALLKTLDLRGRDGRWANAGVCPGGWEGHPGTMCCGGTRAACPRCGRESDFRSSLLCAKCLARLDLCHLCYRPILHGSSTPGAWPAGRRRKPAVAPVVDSQRVSDE